ncbi:MAG: hypothetical protein MUF62_05470 [Chitinophagaceae bacterium]|nr:hypothetical protein [Chitinophagaceae bacterium]
MQLTQKQCLSCSKPLKGRADKKFCDDYCRTQYNNQLKAEDSAVMKRVNAILRSNRRLLAQQIPPGEEMGKCPRQKLTEAGFNFQQEGQCVLFLLRVRLPAAGGRLAAGSEAGGEMKATANRWVAAE